MRLNIQRLLDERDRNPGPLVWHPNFPEQFEAERERRKASNYVFPAWSLQRRDRVTPFEAGLLGFITGTILTALILFGFHYHVL